MRFTHRIKAHRRSLRFCGYDARMTEGFLDESTRELALPPEPAAQELLLAAELATLVRDPEALGEAIARLAAWVVQGVEGHFDDVYARWLMVEGAFHDLDLSLWDGSPGGVEPLALGLAQVNYYRRTDLSVDERFALLTRVRSLLSPHHHLACARVDLERAALLSMAEETEAFGHALTLCDDALACIEQLDDVLARADALMKRAHVLAWGERIAEATAEAEKARQVYAAQDHTHSLANVCHFMAHVHLGRGRVPEAAILSSEAIEGYRRVHDSVGEANALQVRAHVWKARGKVAKALQDCDDAVRLYDRARLRTFQGQSLLLRARFHADGARYDEAQLDLEVAVRYLRRSPEGAVLAFALLRLADILRHRSDLDGAAKRLDQGEEALALVHRDPERARLLLEICRIGKEMPTPDKPRIRRCSAAALALARALGDAEAERWATSYASYAG